MAGRTTLEGKYGKIGVQMLKRITRVLEKIQVPYVLEAGTLLGIVRENRLLPWDNDVDITITRQYLKQLKPSLWRFWLLGYIVRVKHYKRDLKYFKRGEIRIIKIKHVSYRNFFRKDVVVDLFLKKKIGNEYYWTVGVKAPVLKSVPERFYDHHTQIEFEGKQFYVPEDYIGYLECHYGKDWKIPVKEWDYRTSDMSVREIL
jgi:phosphorylcholine metabolism protein LicD